MEDVPEIDDMALLGGTLAALIAEFQQRQRYEWCDAIRRFASSLGISELPVVCFQSQGSAACKSDDVNEESS